MRGRHASAAGALAALGLVQCGPALACHVPVVCDALSLRRRLPRGGTVALTFDDGPHPEGTPRMLSELDRAGATATFFLLGAQVRRHPSLAREISAAGHAIGLHGDTHRCELRLTPAAIADDRARGLDAIGTATDVRPAIHRPPYGAASGPGIVLARRAGLETVLWSRWGRDWRAAATPETVLGDVLGGGSLDRAIVLLHDGAPDGWRATAAALPRILERCAADGLATVRLGGSSGATDDHDPPHRGR